MTEFPTPEVKANAWHSISDDIPLGEAPTMLSLGERKMLRWLSLNWPGKGVIVDAGCFLGGSTIPLTSGKRQVHTYDMFVCPNDPYSQGLIGDGYKPGDSVLDLFRKYTKGSRNITEHVGDFMLSSPPKGSVDILFIDLCKTWELNQRMVSEFFPLLIPGKSIVIQQDHNDQSCPWVNVTMGLLEENFDFLTDEGSSRIYLYKGGFRGMPNIRNLPTQDKLTFISNGARTSVHPNAAYMSGVSSAWIIFEDRGVEAAADFLRAVDGFQPWPGESYARYIESAIRYHNTPDNLQRWHEEYFASA